MMEKAHIKVMTFLLDASQKEELESIARLEDTTISEIMRTSILFFLREPDLQQRILTEAKRP